MKKRIWELDALRGLFIIGVVIVHLMYDLVELYRLIEWEYPPLFAFVMQWGGVLFFLISGISVTLGSRCIRRGLLVLAGGFIISAVTWGMYLLNFADKGIIIYFGVLHCLGVCMLLWPVFRKLPHWALAFVGAALVALGFYLRTLDPPSTQWLAVLGLPGVGFVSSDYFPILPYLGFFLLGSAVGKSVYKHKQSLFPKVKGENPIIRFFLLCGKYSLWIYLLHQPLLNGILFLIAMN